MDLQILLTLIKSKQYLKLIVGTDLILIFIGLPIVGIFFTTITLCAIIKIVLPTLYVHSLESSILKEIKFFFNFGTCLTSINVITLSSYILIRIMSPNNLTGYITSHENFLIIYMLIGIEPILIGRYDRSILNQESTNYLSFK